MAKRRQKVKLSPIEKMEQHRARWQSKLDEAVAMIVRAVPEINYAKKRLMQLRRKHQDHLVEQVPVSVEAILEEVRDAASEIAADIPTFLDRTIAPDVFDAAKRVASGNADKADKDAVRIAKLKAKQTVKAAELRGQRRKMPLTGKAALAAIRETV